MNLLRWSAVIVNNLDTTEQILVAPTIAQLSQEISKKTNLKLSTTTLRNIYWKRTNKPFITINKNPTLLI